MILEEEKKPMKFPLLNQKILPETSEKVGLFLKVFGGIFDFLLC